MAKYTDAKKKNNQKWDAENLKRGAYAMRKELYAQFEKYCNDNGLSKNGCIVGLIEKELEQAGYIEK